MHIACINVGHLVNVDLVESKRKSKIPYIWLFPIGLMMADESEEPEEGFNPVPEPALKEDAIIGEANLGERPSSNKEGIGLIEDWPVDEIPLMMNEEILVEAEGFEMLPEVVVEENAIGGEVAVFGAPLRENPLLKFGSEGTSVLGGEELRLKLGGNLGRDFSLATRCLCEFLFTRNFAPRYKRFRWRQGKNTSRWFGNNGPE
ncbi:hypothetical protein OAK60_01380 [Akkermansiaceae bacterium]|nr:hypothetical protein [Akkermansiaceae bacterium]